MKTETLQPFLRLGVGGGGVGCVSAYRWEGALAEDFPKFEVLRLLLPGLRRLRCLLRLAAGGTIDSGLWGGALHAGTVATACAWDSEWRAGVGVVSYHWWTRAWTEDNTGLNGHNIILERENEDTSRKRTLHLWEADNQNVARHSCFSRDHWGKWCVSDRPHVTVRPSGSHNWPTYQGHGVICI